MTAKTLIVANWKMNPASFKEARRLFEATRRAAEAARHTSAVVAPPALYLRELRLSYKGMRLLFAAQGAHEAPGGAHTGEISMAQLKDARVPYVLVGHAERRAAGETNVDTRERVAAALSCGLTPILCVGESRRDHSGDHFAFVKEQLRTGIANVPATRIAKVIVAYEPLWAIGAAQAMSPQDMHEMSIFVRKTVVEMCGDAGHKVRVLYGGAVDETNVADLLLNGDVAGLLVGRASQEADKFAALMRAIPAF